MTEEVQKIVRPHRVAFVMFDRFCSLDLAGPYEVFGTANARLRSAAYSLITVTNESRTVRAENGLTFIADRLTADVAPEEVETLIVVGGTGVDVAAKDEALIGWVADVARTATRVASVCTGVSLLAAAGVLVGKTVTTHWSDAATLAAGYPDIHVDSDPIYINDGKVWTSAGVTAGIDLGLGLVEADHDASLAQEVARWLVMFLRRPGGQSQYAVPVWSEPTSHTAIRHIQDRVNVDPSGDHRITTLAESVHMSERNFLRTFAREIGCTPASYVEQVRVEAARRELEVSDDGVDAVASRCGFGTAETMRRAFVRRLGVAPSDYRKRFFRTAG